MSYRSTSRNAPRRATARCEGGFTTIELLVALLFVLGVLGGAIVAFVALQRHAQKTKAYLDAMSEARHALTTLSLDLAQAQFGPASATPKNFFVGSQNVLATGNRFDDDGDGQIDEEVYDGKDNDGDWGSTSDRHAAIAPTKYERPYGVGFPDLGDARVDEDTRFCRAELRFRMPGDATTSPVEVRYYVGTFDGQPNVLIREKVTSGSVESGPVAFNVLSFSALYWDSNAPADATRTWKTSWNAALLNEATQVPLPVSVALEVTIYAGIEPIDRVAPSDPLPVVRLSTVVNIESALYHPNYQR